MEADKLMSDILDTPSSAIVPLKREIGLLFQLAISNNSERGRVYIATLLRQTTGQHSVTQQIVRVLVETQTVRYQEETESLNQQLLELDRDIRAGDAEIARLEMARELTKLHNEIGVPPIDLLTSVVVLQTRILSLETELQNLWKSLKY